MINHLLQLLMLQSIAYIPTQSAGIITDAFKKLFSLIVGAVMFVVNGIWSAIKWLGQQIANLFKMLFDLLIAFFTVIYDVIKGLLYFLAQILVILGKVVMLIFEAVKMLWSFLVGIGRTMSQLVYSPRGSSNANVYSTEIGRAMRMANDSLQLKPVAMILLFLVWITTAVLVVRIISSMRNA